MHNLRRVQLSGLRAVEVVGRLGSLRAAAGELGVTVGAVSQQVLKAESQLGRTLFERHPKGLTPTPVGADIVKRLTSGMAELSAAVALADAGRSNTLTVSVAPVLAGKWLVWRLNRFNEAHPDVRIRVEATVALIDPNTSDVDLCIRVGAGGWPDVNVSRLIDQRMFPVCSPDLAGRLSTPADLAAVPIIRDLGTTVGWDVWLTPEDIDAGDLRGGPEYSDAMMCLDAAIAGQGVFLAWDTLANDAISRGQLVAPFAARRASGLSYWFVTARHAPRSPNVEAFRRWLQAELEATLESVAQPPSALRNPATVSTA